jgi:hypothetical protein
VGDLRIEDSAMNPLVIKRFQELDLKAEAIASARTFSFHGEDGASYFNVDSPSVASWATSVLNLLQRVFGEDSIHFKHFGEEFQSFSGYESAFKTCRAVFLAAREDYEGGYLFNMRSLTNPSGSI